MRVFITGGSGLIGRHLARLLEEGHQPVILSRHSDAIRRKPEFREYQVVQGDPRPRAAGRTRSTAATPSSTWPGTTCSPSAGIPRSSGRSATAGSTAPSTWWRRSGRPGTGPRCSCRRRRSASTGRTATRSSTSRVRRGRISWRSSAASGSRPPSRSTELGVRRAIVRTGIVLAPGGGALAFMTPIFKLCPGAPIGSGGGPGRQGPAVDELDPHRRHRGPLPDWPSRIPQAVGPDQRHGAPPGPQRRVLPDALERAPEALHPLAALHSVRPARRHAPAHAGRGGQRDHGRPEGPAQEGPGARLSVQVPRPGGGPPRHLHRQAGARSARAGHRSRPARDIITDRLRSARSETSLT